MTTNEIFTVKGVEFKFIKPSAKNAGETHVWALNMGTKKQTQVALEDIDTPVESLAYQMDVEPREVEMFARSICNSLEQDKVDEFFVNDASDEQRGELTQAYTRHAVKKLQEFHTSFLTNQDVRQLFLDMVYAQVKYDWSPAV